MSGTRSPRPAPAQSGPVRCQAGRDLVVDDQGPVPARQVVQHGEDVRAVDVHAAGTLQHRLDDDGGERVGVRGVQGPGLTLPGDQLGVVRGAVDAAGRSRREHVLGQHAAEESVHAAQRVGHRHRREGVSVVAPAHREEPGAAPTCCEVPLQRHLHRDLDRHRARVGEEDVLEAVGGKVEEPAGEADGGLVGQATEHHVGHRAELPLGRGIELGHGVPVDRAPPRRHGVDDLARLAVAVTQPQPDAVRRLHQVRRLGRECGGVGVPHVVAVERQQRLEVEAVGVGSGRHRAPLCRYPHGAGVRPRRGCSRPREPAGPSGRAGRRRGPGRTGVRRRRPGRPSRSRRCPR